LDCAGKYRAGENPERARQMAHLCRKHRTDQRPRAGDRREMMAVKHVPIGRHIIETIIVPNGGRRSRAIDPERPVGDKQPIKPIGDQIDANRGYDQPGGVNRFTSIERHDGKCHCT
jgi:hypothetical protein